MKKCPWCAEEIQDEAIYCRFCQHDLRSNLSVVRTVVREEPVERVVEYRQAEPDSDGLSIGALVSGWITAEVMAFLVGALIGNLTSIHSIELSAGVFLLTWVSGPLAYFVGGVVAAGVARRDGAKHGFVLGSVGGIISVLLGVLVLNTMTISPSTLVVIGLLMISASLGGGMAYRNE